MAIKIIYGIGTNFYTYSFGMCYYVGFLQVGSHMASKIYDLSQTNGMEYTVVNNNM